MNQRIRRKVIFLPEPAEFRTVTEESCLPGSPEERPPDPFREVEERVRATIEHCSDGVVILEGGRCLYCNRTFSEMIGCGDPRGATDQSVLSAVHPEDREKVCEYARARQGGEAAPERYRCRLVKADGSTLTVEVSAGSIMHDGVPLSVGFVRDITEQEKIEEALRESEARYRTLFEAANDAILLGKGDRIVACNSRALTLFGCERERIIGRTPFDLSPSVRPDGTESREKVLATVEAALLGEPQFFEWRHRRPDGTQFDAEVSLNSIRAGHETFVQAIIRDITDRAQAREALRKSEEALLAMINATQESLFMIDREGFILAGNEVFAGRMGRSLAELTGANFYDYLPPDRAGGIREYLNRVIAFGETVRFEDVRGERIYQTYAYPASDGEGKVRRVAVFERDITHLKHAETALSESEERYRQTVENSPDAIVLHNGERFIYLNPAALRLYGVPDMESLAGKKVLDHIHHEDRQIVLDRTERIGRTAIPSSLREIRILRANGETVPADLTLGMINYHGTRVYQALFRDITRRKKAEKALRESEERYRNIFENAMVGIFRSTWEGKHIDMNPALAKIHGFASPEEMMAALAGDISQLYVHPEDRLRYVRGLESDGFVQGFEVEMFRKDGATVRVSMNIRRIRNGEGRMLYDEGIVEDITERKAAEEALRRRERDLETESALLGEANAALKVLLRHRDEDKRSLEKTIMANVKDLVFPYIEKLKATHPGETQSAYLTMLESNLNGILSPFLQKMAAVYSRFTPTEVQVANLIKNGKSTKEIADLLNVSAGTVNSHRNSIRSKLGFKNQQVNLRTYLMSL